MLLSRHRELPQGTQFQVLILASVAAATTSSSVLQTLHCNYVVSGTCIFNTSFSAQNSLRLQFPGDVVFTDGVILTTQREFSVYAGGSVAFRGNAKVLARGKVALAGMGVQMSGSSVVSSSGPIAVNLAGGSDGDPGGDAQAVAITGIGTTLAGASINLSCRSCPVSVGGGAALNATWVLGGVTIAADTVALTGRATSIMAARVSVVASGITVISAGFPGLPPLSPSGPPVLTDLRVATAGDLQLGGEDRAWRLGNCVLLAHGIVIQRQTIRTQGTSCPNQPTSDRDVCAGVLRGGAAQPAPGGPLPAGNISFDFVAAAQGSLEVRSSSLFAASALVCSGGAARIQDGVTIDATGRGCGIGDGWGHGESRESWLGSGAGGGSHVGSGGRGAGYSSTTVSAMALPGLPYDEPSALRSLELLPTQGASGGGCGIKQIWGAPCPHSEDAERPSAGGGLIWLSGRQVYFGAGVQMSADGNSGVVFPSGSVRGLSVSGGGAGGQILLYASVLAVRQHTPVALSAEGGPIQCTMSKVGGAGGGGLIGLHLAPSAKHGASLSAAFQVSVSGGGMLKDCEDWVPRDGVSETYGQPGVTYRLVPCAAGRAGMFCIPCPVGMWSPDGRVCSACANSPSPLAMYTASGWMTEECPYKCLSAVPDVSINPRCRDVPRFFFHFLHGFVGIAVVLAIFVLLFGALMVRRARRKPDPVVASLSERDNRGCCCGCRHRDREPFAREMLPYHVCRIYFSGRNTRESPWCIRGVLPDTLEPMVLPGQWARYVDEVEGCSRVPRHEIVWGWILRFWYPPLAPLHARRRRWQRADRICQCAREFSSAGSGVDTGFWRPSRAGPNDSSVFSVVFSCDRGATLAYLDFFDTSRCQLDWMLDLRREARLLIAHGHGSYSEPFGIDIDDPLVHQLTQTSSANFATAVFGVIAAFNTVAAQVSHGELQLGPAGPVLSQLQEAVRRHAALCGSDELVQVIVVPQVQGRSRVEQSIRPCDNRQSFTNLVQSCGSSSSVENEQTGSLALMTGESQPPELVQVKFGLAFADTSTPESALQPEVSSGACSMSGPGRGSLLVSPMTHEELAEQLERCSAARCLLKQASTCHRAAQCAMLSSSHFCQSGTTTCVVFSALVVLISVDTLLSVFFGGLLFQMDWRIFVVWCLAPPLTQPCSFVLGASFLFSESPRTGRVFASLALFSGLNMIVSTGAVLWVVGLGSAAFEVAKLATACATKAAVFALASVHVRNLEARHDRDRMPALHCNLVDSAFASRGDNVQACSTGSFFAGQTQPAGKGAGAVPRQPATPR